DYPTNINGYDDNDSTVTSQIDAICSQLAAQTTATSPGYSTSSKPLLIHCIGFGPYFDSGSSTYTANVATLNEMQILGNVTDGMPSYKIIDGTQTQVINDLQQAFTIILQSGVQVALIQ
ncbi:MAG TPA: hypothetical protein VGG30_10445, partial [Pirellulales bacterium]